jgi:hypothetical protein
MGVHQGSSGGNFSGFPSSRGCSQAPASLTTSTRLLSSVIACMQLCLDYRPAGRACQCRRATCHPAMKNTSRQWTGGEIFHAIGPGPRTQLRDPTAGCRTASSKPAIERISRPRRKLPTPSPMSHARESLGWSMLATGSLGPADDLRFPKPACPMPSTIPHRQNLGHHAAPGHLARHTARHLARPKQESARGLSRHMCHAPLRHLARHLARHLGNRPNQPPDMAILPGVGCPGRARRSGHGCPRERPGAQLWVSRTSPEAPVPSLSTPILHPSSASANPSGDPVQRDAPRLAPPPPLVHSPDTRPWDLARVAAHSPPDVLKIARTRQIIEATTAGGGDLGSLFRSPGSRWARVRRRFSPRSRHVRRKLTQRDLPLHPPQPSP